jgi:hypothetical protein
MSKTLFDLVMERSRPTKSDWAALGRGELNEEEVKKLLATDYEDVEEG